MIDLLSIRQRLLQLAQERLGEILVEAENLECDRVDLAGVALVCRSRFQ